MQFFFTKCKVNNKNTNGNIGAKGRLQTQLLKQRRVEE